jgi:hypothetical protein
LTDEKSVAQFRPHSGAGVSTNQTNTNAQNAATAIKPDTTIVPFAHRCFPSEEPADETAYRSAFALHFFMVKIASGID